MAYLQGHTNREIAAMLGVSVSTVRRRISAALARLDEYVRQARIWVASVAVVAFAHVRATRWPGGVPTAAAATATVVALGVAGAAPDFLDSKQGTNPPPAAVQSIGRVLAAPTITLIVSGNPVATGVQLHKDSKALTADADKIDKNCSGKPTNAPPPVPVGPRGPRPHLPPVSHPAGGCRPAD
jgi:sigma-70-like protein